MFGLGLGVAILIDVLIVRMVVSPALMALLATGPGGSRLAGPGAAERSLEGGHEDRAERVSEREKVAA